MINADVTDGTASTTAGSRNFILPTSVGTFLIVDTINVITPANVAPDSGTRVALTPVSKSFLDVAWASSTGATVPQFYSYVSQNTALTGSQTQPQVIFGPWPDAAYRVEVTGKIQPQALSATNTTTWLSQNLPDLFLAASMIYMSGFMRNFGAQSDDPKMATSWEGIYAGLKESAMVWEARKRFAGASWTPKQLEQNAQPQRG